jgi:hypothetical protein
VDKAEDDMLDSGDELMDELSASAEEPAAPAEAKDAETLEETKEPETTEEAKEAKEAKKPVDLFADEKKTDMTPFLLVAGVLGLTVLLLLVAWAGYWNFPSAVYVSGLTFVPLLLWLSRKTNTVYVVLLGCGIVVLMTSIYLLWVRLADDYRFDVKASEAKQRVGMVQPVDRGWQLAIRADATDTRADC